MNKQKGYATNLILVQNYHFNNIINMNSTASTTRTPELHQKQPKIRQSQTIFKYICLVAVLILLLCVPGFLNFRQYCQMKGYYVFSQDSLSWISLGFILIFVSFLLCQIARYSYYKFCRSKIARLVKEKYEGEEREKKIDMLMKLSYDSAYYLTMTIIAYYNFRSEYWFPDMAGGCGVCQKIYDQFPDWPTDKRSNIQGYFCFQLGVHAFLLFELFVFRRQDRKFYQWTLHHTIASSLILFSMMCNQIAAGVMILIIHDTSDVFMSFSRFYFQANIPSLKKIGFQIVIAILLIFSWIYFRLVIFPFCLLSNVYINNPLPTDQWYIIKYEYMYLLTMAFILVGMHLYWTFYLTKSVFAFIRRKDNPNTYDIHKKQ